jgi:hypothetical protein
MQYIINEYTHNSLPSPLIENNSEEKEEKIFEKSATL